MKHLKTYLAVLVFALSFQAFSQSNVFLHREFWDSKPSVEILEKKIKEGNNPSEANNNNFDGVVYAILQNAPFKSIVYLMSQKGNDVNKLTHDGRTYIFWAAYKGNTEIVAYLLENGAKTDLTDDKGSTIINFAAGAGQANTKVYDLILNKNPDLIKKKNPNGANALLLGAPKDTDFKLISYFQSQGLDIKSVDNDDNGIFNYVAKAGNIELMKSLIEKGLKGTDQAFLFAATGTRGTSNGIEVYKYLESVGLNPNVSNNDGINPLHILASSSKDETVINHFIEKGVDVFATDNRGNSAFMNAASRNNLTIVKSLSQYLKEVNLKNKKGQSALSLAVGGNDADVVEFLLNNGADTSVIDEKGNDLTYYLINSYSSRNKAQFSEKLALLKRRNIDLSTVQKSGNTWYHLAVEKNSLELLKLATEMKQDINAKNSEGNTALHLAAMKAKDDAILKFLIAQGADKKVTTDFEESAYDLAQENELLSKQKVSIEFLK
ncbi:ankyrin repeat domain-containing protein [Winogradskyella eckloniae]|uniref:ankyrin repeat domain-containing protein n=1 Tax=Winogradskyella eckloniae TaxID=1089306 RepID=UPI001566AAF7|nr:ankyrin repeat domain-containing protein [Winogradskyella eckloniae]NRD20438.1 ankyrin repeat domain-containing protein [Winogradskyella eckloniae]